MPGELDPRLHPFRGDLAAETLRDRVAAPRYAAGTVAEVRRGTADLRRLPAASAPLDTQLLRGERVQVFDRADGWAWVQNQTDGYVGYVPESALGVPGAEATHWIAAVSTYLFPEPDIKAPPADVLPMTARIAAVAERGRFVELEGGFVFAAHVAPLDAFEPDYVATARRFLGVPYLWGGKSFAGLDCSGHVQIALARAGIACQRDSDMQAEAVGRAVPPDAAPEPGDLLYMPGHVAIALEAERVLHATAAALAVVIEPLADLLARVERESGCGLTAIRRL
jgi:cell wall-associated NlpC family hydrolase